MLFSSEFLTWKLKARESEDSALAVVPPQFLPIGPGQGCLGHSYFDHDNKNTAFLALVGMVLVTILLITSLTTDVLGVVRGLIPAMRLLTSFIYAFAGLSVVVFLYTFHKAQS
jgi:hypothetical protein